VTTTAPIPEPPPAAPPEETATPDVYERVHAGAAFARLRAAHRSFALPATIAFASWYLSYVLLSVYAPDLVGATLFGHVNVALVLGLAQFASTFAIAWAYSRRAARLVDPLAERVRAEVGAVAPRVRATRASAVPTGEGA
jgi:uncharacterized membrane protein (DUF485 family)